MTQPTLSATPILSVQNLTICADSAVLVNKLSYEIGANETLAIVGESGSGKSISSLALLGLLPNNLSITGQMQLAGVGELPIANGQVASADASHVLPLSGALSQQREQRFKAIRGRRLGMIFQEPMTALNPLHTVGKQLAESLRLADASKLSKAQIAKECVRLLTDVNISDPKGKLTRYPHELSGGQRQRVMIAMALAQRPDVLIADEPTTALDVTLQHDILALLMRLKQQYGMSMILISHDLNLVRRYSDYIIVMRHGMVIEQGETQRIFTQPKADYTKLLMSQDFGKALAVTELAEFNQKASTINATAKPTTELNINVLMTKELSVSYPQETGWLGGVKSWSTALESLNLELPRGHAIGIVGESGSGKTTAALAIARLLTGQAKVQGEVIIGNEPIYQLRKSPLRLFRSQVQMVFQDPFASINPRFTVRQIVEEGLLVQGQNQQQRRQAVLEGLKTVQLGSELADRYPHELSGGQRQRVALARALVMRPKLILLDEPTSALDSTTQVTIVALLRQIQQEFGISYVFISHDLKVVRALCQRVMVIENGRCVESADTETLFNQPQHDYAKRLIKASLDSADFA